MHQSSYDPGMLREAAARSRTLADQATDNLEAQSALALEAHAADTEAQGGYY
jgi:hypothetical protein